VPLEATPFATGVVATPRRLAAVALGPLIAPRFHFLELIVVVEYWSFTTLRLPDVVQRAISAPGLSVGEVMLVEQSRPELIWPMDIILGAGGNAILSGCWRAFALGHRLRVGDRLVLCFKLGTLEALVRIFTAAPSPSPRRRSKGAAPPWRSYGEGISLLPSFVMLPSPEGDTSKTYPLSRTLLLLFLL
jgi:hypothetical protein